MAVHHVDLDDCYIPKTESQEIIVNVEIGDGQSGSYAVFSGTRRISANSPARIGTKTEVTNKDTIISATVVDVLTQTNWTSMTVKVSEGPHVTQFGPYSVLAQQHLDTVMYSLKLVHSL